MSATKRYLFQFLNTIEVHNDKFKVEWEEDNVKIIITQNLEDILGQRYSSILEIDKEMFEDIIKHDYPKIKSCYNYYKDLEAFGK